MYVKMTEGEDDKMSNRWQKDADGILIFVSPHLGLLTGMGSAFSLNSVAGLFSAALAAFAAVSVQDLKPNPQDNSAFYLANIYQLLADPTISRESIDVIVSGFAAEVDAVAHDIHHEDQQTCGVYKVPMEMYAFLLNWSARSVEKDNVPDEDASAATVPAKSRKGRGRNATQRELLPRIRQPNGHGKTRSCLFSR
jgi:Family of unknown function (DUF6535)/non-SMC mitotic condensation complex subunit 1, N-term